MYSLTKYQSKGEPYVSQISYQMRKTLFSITSRDEASVKMKDGLQSGPRVNGGLCDWP